MDGVDNAPDVCNLVFEEAAGEGENAVKGLGNLKEEWIIECFRIEGDGEIRQIGRERGCFEVGGW